MRKFFPITASILPDQLASLNAVQQDQGSTRKETGVMFRAPILLMPGDLVELETDTGDIFEIQRHGESVWTCSGNITPSPVFA